MKKTNILVYAPAVVNKVRIEKLRGIIAYAKRNDLPWEFVHTGPNFYEQSNLRRSLKEADAVISHTTDENEIELIRAQNLPWISLALPENHSDIFLVTDDDQSIGQMAAEHLLQHRVKTLLFTGPQTRAGKTALDLVSDEHDDVGQALRERGGLSSSQLEKLTAACVAAKDGEHDKSVDNT